MKSSERTEIVDIALAIMVIVIVVIVGNELSFHASRIELDKTESSNAFFELLFFHFRVANESSVFIKNSTYRQLARSYEVKRR